jgi:hypothetical protein
MINKEDELVLKRLEAEREELLCRLHDPAWRSHVHIHRHQIWQTNELIDAVLDGHLSAADFVGDDKGCQPVG